MELELGEYYRNGVGQIVQISSVEHELVDGGVCTTFAEKDGFTYTESGIAIDVGYREDLNLVEHVIVVGASDLDEGPCICDECMSEQGAGKASEDASVTLSDIIVSVADALVSDIEDAVGVEYEKTRVGDAEHEKLSIGKQVDKVAEIELEDGEWYFGYVDVDGIDGLSVFAIAKDKAYRGMTEVFNVADVVFISKIEKPEVE